MKLIIIILLILERWLDVLAQSTANENEARISFTE